MELFWFLAPDTRALQKKSTDTTLNIRKHMYIVQYKSIRGKVALTFILVKTLTMQFDLRGSQQRSHKQVGFFCCSDCFKHYANTVPAGSQSFEFILIRYKLYQEYSFANTSDCNP